MITTLLQEDKVLKKVTQTPKDQKPRFAWRTLAISSAEVSVPSSIKVNVGGAERDFDAEEIADTVGCALTDLFLARQKQEGDIFNESNQQLVQKISQAVTEEIYQRTAQLAEGSSGAATLNSKDIYHCIERALINNNAHDVARTLAEKRKRAGDPFADATIQPLIVNTKVIRRSGQLVPWNHNKIEIAVRKAFLSLEMDSSPAVAISEVVSRIIAEENKQFIHIEDVQNLVEEELMKQGFFKVARAYIQYRALRNTMRDADEIEAAAANEIESQDQQSLILVKTADGNSFLWDGTDLKKRIDFAMLGLDLCLTRAEIETSKRPSSSMPRP
jgi:ribonucleoside-diphosphate reductase alpha chain